MKIRQYELKLDKEVRLSYLEMVKSFEYECEEPILNTPKEIYDFMESVFHLSSKAEECVFMLAFNTRCRLIGVFELSRGTVNFSVVGPREVYIRALLAGASLIVIVHNHPSLSIVPSKEDIKVTEQLQESGKLLGISLCDHIIVGKGFYSMKQAGVL